MMSVAAGGDAVTSKESAPRTSVAGTARKLDIMEYLAV